MDDDGLAFRDVARARAGARRRGAGGGAPGRRRGHRGGGRPQEGLGRELDAELAPFLDEKGRPEEAYRGSIGGSRPGSTDGSAEPNATISIAC